MNVCLMIMCAVATWAIGADARQPAQDVTVSGADAVVFKSSEQPSPPRVPKKLLKRASKKISFNFVDEDLTAVIQKIARVSGVNVLLPQGADAITQKITVQTPNKITLEQALRFLDTFLELIGYSRIYKQDVMVITKIDQNISREVLSLYVDVPPADLPKSGRIRAIYYLQNLRVPDSPQGQDPLIMILNDMLSPQASFVFDSKSNAIIISDRAELVASVMRVILELDSSGYPPIVEVVRIYNTNASMIADLLRTQILAVSGTATGALRADVKAEPALYFNTTTRVIADPRTNSIIMMGREPALIRLKDFISELDQPEDSGNSVLHVYELQYLDAADFSQVLTRIVAPRGSTDSSQATKDNPGGHERGFEGVVITYDTARESKVVQQSTAQTQSGTLQSSGQAAQFNTATIYTGGNRLVIAARKKDWDRLHALIKSLDKPEPQVLLEILIIDVTVDDKRLLATQLRDKFKQSIFQHVNYQTSFVFDQIVLNQAAPSGQQQLAMDTLAADLLTLFPSSGSFTQPHSLVLNAWSANPGSAFMSLADTNQEVFTTPSADGAVYPLGSPVWLIFQVLSSLFTTKVISHPFLSVLNNREAEEWITDIRRAVGGAMPSTNIISISQEDLRADLKIKAVPRVSSSQRLNLQLVIDINQFSGAVGTANALNRLTRRVETNVNMDNGAVLALGGLMQLTETETSKQTPLLGRIPLLGALFRGDTLENQKTNLMVFITPTIIEPKIRGGMNKYTQEKIAQGFEYLNGGALFDNLHDPVTKFFFNPSHRVPRETMEGYLADSLGDYVYSSEPQCKKLLPDIEKAESCRYDIEQRAS